MLKIGLTGNIGSGKTWVCKVFEALSIPVFYADLEARKILNTATIIEEIIDVYGSSVKLSHKEIDRKALANIVFNDALQLKKLNRIIHPKLTDTFLRWADAKDNFPYVIQEAAILFENGFDSIMDKNITVTAPQQLRLQRVMERDLATKEEVLARMAHQWSDEKKAKAADFIINNDGKQMILPQVLKIHHNFIL